eukprot:4507460-Lingulodinium_polyedra.AAC.1
MRPNARTRCRPGLRQQGRSTHPRPRWRWATGGRDAAAGTLGLATRRDGNIGRANRRPARRRAAA